MASNVIKQEESNIQLQVYADEIPDNQKLRTTTTMTLAPCSEPTFDAARDDKNNNSSELNEGLPLSAETKSSGITDEDTAGASQYEQELSSPNPHKSPSYPVGKFHINGHQIESALSPSDPTMDYMLNHVMLRVRDPAASLHFYTKLMGMRTIFVLNTGPMTVHYLGHPVTAEHQSDPIRFATETAADLCKTKGLLELVHVHGSEHSSSSPSTGKGTTGVEMPFLGFGHLGFTVPDVEACIERLRSAGVEVVKEVNDTSREGAGLMTTTSAWKGEKDSNGVEIEIGAGEMCDGFKTTLSKIGFVKDPDGYLVEILPKHF